MKTHLSKYRFLLCRPLVPGGVGATNSLLLEIADLTSKQQEKTKFSFIFNKEAFWSPKAHLSALRPAQAAQGEWPSEVTACSGGAGGGPLLVSELDVFRGANLLIRGNFKSPSGSL